MSDIIVKGNTNAAVTTGPFTANQNLKLLIVTNKTGGTITMNLTITNGSGQVSLSPKDVQLAAGTSYEDDNIVVLATEKVTLTVTGSCDYFFDFQPAT